MCSLARAPFFCSRQILAALAQLLLLTLAFLIFLGLTEHGAAQQSDPSISVAMGLGGYWKVGYPTQTKIDIQAGSQALTGRVEVQTCDGDGVGVVYSDPAWQVQLQANAHTQMAMSIKHGRSNRPILIRILQNDGQLVREHLLNADERGTVLPATQPWVVGIGTDGLKLDQGLLKSARGTLPEYSSTSLTKIEQLPTSWLGYSGVDLLVLSSSNISLNQALAFENAEAIHEWVVQGGHLAMTLGMDSPTLMKHSNLAAILPGTLDRVSGSCESGPLESFLSSQTQLDSLQCAVCSLRTGTVELTTQGIDRLKFPLIARWALGCGKVVYLATEIDSPEMNKWDNRTSVLKLLLDGQWERKSFQRDKLRYQGYDDLSGQLNATLDRFPNLTLGDLTSISIIAGLLCLIIGPFDYFVVSRSWKRPRGTWVTLGLCSIGSCMIATGLAQSWKPTTPSMNTLELIDIDLKTQNVNGRAFSHFYGGTRGSFDFEASRRGPGGATKGVAPASAVSLDWFGQPGRGLGGFESTVATDRGMPNYRIQGSKTISNALETSRARAPGTSFGLFGVGIPTAGTKALSARWSERVEIPSTTNSLTLVAGSIDLLDGSITNPLEVDLLDSMLVYRGRAYSNSTRFRSGETMTLTQNSLPKDVVRKLQRRQSVGAEERSVPWDPGSNDNLDRLVEMIAFHQSAGGSNYTGLYNRYLGELDASDVMRYDYAVLLARVDEPALAWSVHRDSIPVPSIEGNRRTYLRLFIPVARSSKASINTELQRPSP
jgi:hypothetical protein